MGGHKKDKWIWINNTKEEKKVFKTDNIPKGWQLGRVKQDNNVKEKISKTLKERGINKGIKRTAAQKQKISESKKGKSWYHNPETNKSSMYFKEDVPIGWIKGRGKVNMPKRK